MEVSLVSGRAECTTGSCAHRSHLAGRAQLEQARVMFGLVLYCIWDKCHRIERQFLGQFCCRRRRNSLGTSGPGSRESVRNFRNKKRIQRIHIPL